MMQTAQEKNEGYKKARDAEYKAQLSKFKTQIEIALRTTSDEKGYITFNCAQKYHEDLIEWLTNYSYKVESRVNLVALHYCEAEPEHLKISWIL